METTETKREKFIRLVEPRVDRALHAIHVISLLGGSNSYNYDYGDSDVEVIIAALTEAVDKMAAHMKHPPRNRPLPFDLSRSGAPQ